MSFTRASLRLRSSVITIKIVLKMKSRKKDKQLDINPDDLLDSEELIEKKINKGIGIVDNYIYIIIIHSIIIFPQLIIM